MRSQVLHYAQLLMTLCLAKHFLQSPEALRDAGRRYFSPAALRKLARYPWPGNVRELHNIVQQSALLADGPQILPEHIPLPLAGENPHLPMTYREARGQAIGAFERTYVEELLRSTGGNVTRAAKEAGRNRRAIGRLIKKYRIDRTAL
ncbi:MAG TPA: helix-turn-helix domain-containing protein [Streptosporangiaceae bacterium]